MIVIKNKLIPFKGYKAINLFGIVFTKTDLEDTELNHESIHTAQMKELLYIFFYLWYIIEYIIIWIFNLSKSQHEHYKQISFEQEAELYENNLIYLTQRKPYTWIKFIKIK